MTAGAKDRSELSEPCDRRGDYIGTFTIDPVTATIIVDAWSNIIQDDDGSRSSARRARRGGRRRDDDAEALERRSRDKDTLLSSSSTG